MKKNNKTEPSIKEFRHKAERHLLTLGYTLTIIITLSCFLVIYVGGELKTWTLLILAGLLVPVFGSFIVRFMYYKKITNAIEINNEQLPELYKLYKDIALKMDFEEETIPPLYVVNGFGIKRFFASKPVFHEKYIILKSDVANMIYEEKPKMSALRFIIAHHLAYVKCNHTNLKRLTVVPIMKMLFLEKSLSLAEQYTADRVASYYFPNDIEDTIKLHLTANLGEKVNINSYFEDVEKYHNNIFLKFANLMTDKLAYKRLNALKDAQAKGWNIHGKIF